MESKDATAVIKIQKVALIVSVLLLLLKFFAYYKTSSNTVLTDALESIVNVVAGAFALFSLYVSYKPRDSDHPYGHGKIEFISSGFEGILIAIAGLLIIWKSVFSFFHPHVIGNFEIGAILILAGGLANYIMGYYLEKQAAKYSSIVLEADGKHLKADAYSSVAILLGVVIIWITNITELDNVFAILAGVYISYVGIKLIRKSLRGIMDETDTGIITPMIAHLNSNRQESWIDIHNLRVIQYGSMLHVDCHVTLPWYFTLEQTHTEIEAIDAVINQQYQNKVELFIHPDPCIPDCCKLCRVKNCDVRKFPFENSIEWNLENVVLNRKHGL